MNIIKKPPKSLIELFFSVLFVTVLYGVLYYKLPFVYGTNDDPIMKDLISGALTGTPDGHVYYINYALGFFLSLLYRIQNQIPWYGIYFLGLSYICNITFVYTIFRKLSSLIAKFIVGALYFIGFICLQMWQVAQLQFTSVASLAGITAIFLFFVASSNPGETVLQYLKKSIPIFIFCILSFVTRQNSFFMLLPICGVIWLYRFLKEREDRWKHILFALILFVLLLLFYLVDYFAFSSKEWKDFKVYNYCDTITYDYYGYPNYSKNQSLYEDAGISPVMYQSLVHNYFLLFYDLSSTDMLKLAEASKEDYALIHPVSKGLSQALDSFINRRQNSFKTPESMLVLFTYIFCILLFILQKKWKLFLPLIMIFSASFICWMYILYYGRLPQRIILPLYMAEFMALIGLCIHEKLLVFQKYSWIKSLAIGAFILFIGWLAFPQCLQNFYTLQKENIQARASTEDLKAIKSYCFNQPDSIFYMDLYSISNYTEYVLSFEPLQYNNYILTGGWPFYSPPYLNNIASYGISDAEKAFLEDDNVYFIFALTEKTPSNYLWNYLDSKYQYSYQQTDKFTTPTGLTYGVYKAELIE